MSFLLPERDPLGARDEVRTLAAVRVIDVNPTDDLVGRVHSLDTRFGRHLQNDLVHQGKIKARCFSTWCVNLRRNRVNLFEPLCLTNLRKAVLVDSHAWVQWRTWCEQYTRRDG